MTDKARIKELCENNTDYTDAEINVILDKAYALDELADVFDCDIFIDVPLTDSTASMVVYHALPISRESIYNKSPVGQLALKANEPGVWKVSSTGGSLKGYKAFTQEDLFIRQNIYAINIGKKVLGVCIFETSMNESNRTKREKTDYTIMTAKLNSHIGDAIYFFDALGKLVYQNDEADSISNIIKAEDINYDSLFGKQVSYKELVLSDEEKLEKEIQLAGKHYMLRRILLKDDKLKFAIILKDITLLKDKEAEIISKTEAIRETHHRVKNNLQTMASLLRMERRRSKSEDVKKILADNMNRIMSIAATHDILTRQLGDEVDLSSVLKVVVKNIQRSYSFMDYVSLTIDAKTPVIVLSEIATSVSLVINELVQNSYNHAFLINEKGKIHISITESKGKITLSVSDDGVGFNIIDEAKNNSLGLFIVQSYVKDRLKGNIQFNKSKKGMEVTFQFYLNDVNTMVY